MKWDTIITHIHKGAVIKQTKGCYKSKIINLDCCVIGLNAYLISSICERDNSGYFFMYLERELFSGLVKEDFDFRIGKVIESRLASLEERAKKDVVVI
jgi:hypothetical protein